MSKNTPTPWKTARNNGIKSDLGDCRVVFAAGRDVAYCPPTDGDEGNANADLIVRSVNSHADLLAAAKDVLAHLNARIDAAVKSGAVIPVFAGIAALHSAIAKAEGEE
jgi:hypothetical protein